MKMDESIGVVGEWTLVLRGPDGREKERRVHKNLIPSAGLAYLAGILAAVEATIPKYLAVGTGTTDPAAGDAALEAEIGTRVSGTQSRVTTTVANDTSQVVGTFAAGNGTGALTECGLLTASTDGTLISRIEFAVINKAAADTLELTHKIKFANA
ncbi:MAG TPA: hypothetical protein VNE39_18430 [Planctomycetota bacterium]|nr:hypothetical protein [Planctomycetota bacterium]